jgi:hypothetical protein
MEEAVAEQQQRDLEKFQRLRLKHAQALAAEAYSGAGLLNEAQVVSGNILQSFALHKVTD